MTEVLLLVSFVFALIGFIIYQEGAKIEKSNRKYILIRSQVMYSYTESHEDLVEIHTRKASINIWYLHHGHEVLGKFYKDKTTNIWINRETGDPAEADDKNLSHILDYVNCTYHLTKDHFWEGSKLFKF